MEAREREVEEMRRRAVEAAARRSEGRVRAEEASALIRAAAVRDREREAEEMRQRAAGAAMRRAERLAAGENVCAALEAAGDEPRSPSEFSGVELSDDGSNDDWMVDESALGPVEAPGPLVVVEERRVEWVIGVHQPRVETPPRADEQVVVAVEDENWDDQDVRDVEWRPREIPMFRPRGGEAREEAVAPPRLSRSARRRARRYNPRRHLEHGDYVPAGRSPSPVSETGPPI